MVVNNTGEFVKQTLEEAGFDLFGGEDLKFGFIDGPLQYDITVWYGYKSTWCHHDLSTLKLDTFIREICYIQDLFLEDFTSPIEKNSGTFYTHSDLYIEPIDPLLLDTDQE